MFTILFPTGGPFVLFVMFVLLVVLVLFVVFVLFVFSVLPILILRVPVTERVVEGLLLVTERVDTWGSVSG